MIFNELKEQLVLFSEIDGYVIHFGALIRPRARLIANRLVNIQPIEQPLGLIFYMDFFDTEPIVAKYEYSGIAFYAVEQMLLCPR